MPVLGPEDGGTEDEEQDSTSDDPTESGYVDAPEDSTTNDDTNSGSSSTTDRGGDGRYIEAKDSTSDDTTDSDGDTTDRDTGGGNIDAPEEDSEEDSAGIERDDSSGFDADRGTGGGRQRIPDDDRDTRTVGPERDRSQVGGPAIGGTSGSFAGGEITDEDAQSAVENVNPGARDARSQYERQLEAETGLDAGEDFTVREQDGEFVVEYTDSYRERAAADAFSEQTDAYISPGDVVLDDETARLDEQALQSVAEVNMAEELGVSRSDVSLSDGRVIPETDVGAEALAAYSVTSDAPSAESVSVEEVLPGVFQATAENTGGVADAPGSEQRTAVAATAEGVGLLDELEEYEDVRANLQAQAQQAAAVEAGQRARANAAALDEASGFTQSIFSSGESDSATSERSSEQADVFEGVDTDQYGAEVPDMGDLNQRGPQTAVGQRSVSADLDGPLTPDAKQGGEGIIDFLQTGARRTQPALQAALNPGAIDGIPRVDLSPVTDPAGDVLRGAGGAAAAQFAVFAPVSDQIGTAASTVENQLRRTPGVLQDASDTTVSVTEDVVEGADAATGGALSTGVTGLLEAGVDTADAVGDFSEDVEETTRDAAGGAAAAAAIYTAPFAREGSPVREAAEEAGSVTREVGELSAAAGRDVAEDLDDATGGVLSDAAGVAGRPAAGTLFLGQQTAETAQDVNQLDETDYEAATDQFVASALRDDPRVTGGPLPVFSVATPAGAQSFLSSSDDAATAAQLADETTGGAAGAGGTASGGGTGTTTAAATDEVMQTVSLSTAGAFVDELDVSEGGLFVDEQEVTGTEDVFVDEKPIPDPTQLNVGPLGVPELGVRIGPSENQANWEIDELGLPQDSQNLFVDELEVTEDDEFSGLPLEAQQLLGRESLIEDTEDTGKFRQRGTNVPNEFIPDESVVIGEDSPKTTGGGFPSVPGRAGPGQIEGGANVIFIGRTPNPERMLPDATDEFFGVDLTNPYTGTDALEDAQDSVTAGGEATDPYAGGSTETGDVVDNETDSGALQDINETPSVDTTPDSTVGVDTSVGAAVDVTTATAEMGVQTETGFSTGTGPGYETPDAPDFGDPVEYNYEYSQNQNRFGRPRRPRIPLPEDSDSPEPSGDFTSLFDERVFDTGIADVDELDVEEDEDDRRSDPFSSIEDRLDDLGI